MPASFSLSVLISLLAALAGYVFLAVQQNSPRDDYAPLTLPGPVVLGAVDGVKLDGLTLVRTVRLPAIKINLPGIGTLKIKNQTSELVFDKLRVTDVRVRAADAASGALHTSAKASLDFKGTVLATTEFAFDLSWLGLGRKTFKKTTSGRLSAAIEDLIVALPLQIGKTKAGNPTIHNHKLVFNSGSFTRLEFSTAPAAHIATKLPLWITMAPISNFLLSDFLKSKEVQEMLLNVWMGIKPYLDPVSWQEITIERQLPTPKPSLFPDKLQTSFSIIGPTNFTHINLPDHSPKLYKEKGKLAYMQSWNKFTSEVKCDITKNTIERLGFTKVAMEWLTETPSSTHANDMADVITEAPLNSNVYTMICRIEGLFAEVSSSFKLYADMGKVLQLVTNQRQVGEKGDSRAQARAARFELVFQVTVEETGVTVKTIRVDDLDHIEVTISGLRTRANDLVNSALKIVKPQIATVAGMLVRSFLEERVKQSTKAFETIEEALLLRGVEVPGVFRSRPRIQQALQLATESSTTEATTNEEGTVVDASTDSGVKVE